MINVSAQGHNAVRQVRLEPATPGSLDKHSGTMATALLNCITDTTIREYSEFYCRETHVWQETRSLVEFSLTFLSGLNIIEREVNTCISKP